jgi:hypothetical protein
VAWSHASVEQHINALDLLNALDLRERVLDHLALFVGTRPGKVLALQRRHVELRGYDYLCCCGPE